MSQSKCLRAIGQSLEIFQVAAFNLKREVGEYVVQAESLPQYGSEAILASTLMNKRSNSEQLARQYDGSFRYEGSMRYNTTAISWLDSYGRRKRRNRLLANRRGARKLSHLLRSLGEYLDRMELSAQSIVWSPDSISVECLKNGGKADRKTFSAKELHELALRMSFRRRHHSATA